MLLQYTRTTSHLVLKYLRVIQTDIVPAFPWASSLVEGTQRSNLTNGWITTHSDKCSGKTNKKNGIDRIQWQEENCPISMGELQIYGSMYRLRVFEEVLFSWERKDKKQEKKQCSRLRWQCVQWREAGQAVKVPRAEDIQCLVHVTKEEKELQMRFRR